MRVFTLLGLWACCLAVGQALSSLDLSDEDWQLVNSNGSLSFSTHVPSYALNELIRAGELEDPLLGFNERKYRWVAHEKWTYSVTFDVPAAMTDAAHVDLVLNGVDTFASVFLNGAPIAELDSYHKVHTISVDGKLTAGDNKLKIVIKPALDATVERKKNHPYTVNTLAAYGAYDTYNYARKPAFDFGWDWGPTFAASGIHGSVRLVAYDVPSVQGVHMHQTKAGNNFILDTESEFRVPAAGGGGVLTAELPGLGIKKQVRVRFSKSRASTRGFAKLKIAVPAKDVDLWWPVGYGKQPLYDLKVTFVPGKAGCAASNGGGNRHLMAISDPLDVDAATVPAATRPSNPVAAPQLPKGSAAAAACGPSSSVAKRVGFRVLEVVQDPLPKAANDLIKQGAGWLNYNVKPLKSWNEGQFALVNGTQWTYVANSPNIKNPDYHSGYDWPSPPGGDDTWWWYGAPDNLTDNPAKAQWITGESMYFRVNGIPIYAKGANIIPFHVLKTNATKERMDRVLQNALDSHMNMLRIWGGGLYPDEYLYDWADENGVLMWQESMFACSFYPRDNAMLANIAAETEQAVRRYSSHASLAIWGGNNEIETSMEWYENTRQNQAMYAVDFAEIFIHTIGKTIGKLLPSLTYLDSSPTNGLVSKDPWVKRWGWAQDPRYGDVHFYDYMADCQKFSSFPNAKFVSEYGWQAYPHWLTWSAATGEDEQAVGNEMFEWRNRHPNGTYELANQFSYHFDVPATEAWATGDKAADKKKLKSFIYFSQIQQMLCYDTSVGFWRRSRSEPTSLTMGVLYWQLNDVWVGPTWSGIDFMSRWKPLQYAIKKQFAPIVIQAVLDNSDVKVYTVSDLVKPITGELSIKLRSISDDSSSCAAAARRSQASEASAAVASAYAHGRSQGTAGLLSSEVAADEKVAGDLAVKIVPLGSAEVWKESIYTLQNMPGCKQGECYVEVTLVAKDGDTVHTSEAVVFLQELKDVTLQKPNVQLSSFKQLSDTSVRFTVSVDAPAPHTVWESSIIGRFSHNGLTLHPCRPRTVTFTTYGEPVSAADVEASMVVDTLFMHSQH